MAVSGMRLDRRVRIEIETQRTGLPRETHCESVDSIVIHSKSDRPKRRIRATDLHSAQQMYRRLRQDDHGDPGYDILLDVLTVVAEDARTARQQWTASDSADPTSVHYVGTPTGLASLIGDIRLAGVADGVVLQPIGDGSVTDHILRATIPLLRAQGWLIVDPPPVDSPEFAAATVFGANT